MNATRRTTPLRSLVSPAVVFAALFAMTRAASAETFATGQTVYASPSGASNDWYRGCVVKDGRSNRSYQVECGGTTWWVKDENMSTHPPTAGPDPMHPGHTLVPIVSDSHPAAVAVGDRSLPTTRSVAVAPPAKGAADGSGGGYAADMHRRIERDRIDAKTATLVSGKYTCYAGGRYTFMDLIIRAPHSYSVRGASGTYSYANGALTFQSGPYAGAYSRMVDGHTIGVSAKGSTNLGTQCGLER